MWSGTQTVWAVDWGHCEWMTKLLNWMGEPELVRDKGKARAVEDEEESDQEDGDEDETDE